MASVHHVERLSGGVHTPRPDVRNLVDHDIVAARRTTVSPLFPGKDDLQSPVERALSKNVFADLTRPPHHDDRASRARTRVARMLPIEGIPEITNIFNDDCAEVSEELFNGLVQRYQAEKRPLQSVREEISALHDDISYHQSIAYKIGHPLETIGGTMAAVLVLGLLIGAPIV